MVGKQLFNQDHQKAAAWQWCRVAPGHGPTPPYPSGPSGTAALKEVSLLFPVLRSCSTTDLTVFWQEPDLKVVGCWASATTPLLKIVAVKTVLHS